VSACACMRECERARVYTCEYMCVCVYVYYISTLAGVTTATVNSSITAALPGVTHRTTPGTCAFSLSIIIPSCTTHCTIPGTCTSNAFLFTLNSDLNWILSWINYTFWLICDLGSSSHPNLHTRRTNPGNLFFENWC